MLTKRTVVFTSLVSLVVTMFLFRSPLAWQQAGFSHRRPSPPVDRLPGLRRLATVVRDKYGVPHITASSDHDVYFMMGYLHAQDRFFQMDVMRRQGNGALAELLGAGPGDLILGDDIQLRSIGIARAARRSLSSYSAGSVALMQAYSDGVNAWLDTNPLPPEYAALEITSAPRWTPLDSVTVVKLIQFQLSFDTTDLERTLALLNYQAAGQARGFDGVKLFFEDLYTFTPFEPVVTIPRQTSAASLSSREIQAPHVQSQLIDGARRAEELVSPEVIEAARNFMERYEKSPTLNRAELGVGSNWWVVAGSKTNSGNAMLANDPHLGLGLPPIFYEIHLTVDERSSPINVYGVSFAGVPGVFLGQNKFISWGATTAAMDVTDFFAESVVIQNGIPVATTYRGNLEPLVTIPEEFRINQVQNGVEDDVMVVSPGPRPTGVSVPAATFIAPRRNNGPLLPGGPTGALSIQYAGASATRDLEGVFALARARNLTDFKRALEFLEVGSFNWAYADVNGNIASFINGKIPLREDLQSGIVDGLAPFFIRDGTGAARNEWIPRNDNEPGFNYESLPFDELPQIVNPDQGFLVSANNDPLGIMLDNNPLNQMRDEGIYYISAGFSPGFRAAKITSLLTKQLNNGHGDCKLSFRDMQHIQANVQLPDAEVFTPYILNAHVAARSPGSPAELAALANDPAVSEAVSRLSTWDFSAPTGIPQGYDAGDGQDLDQQPSDREVANSVAATIYTVWRSQIITNTILATLQRVGLGGLFPASDRLLVDLRLLLDNFSTNRGVGASGLDFFAVPGVNAPPEIRRDGIILKSLKDALDLLAGAEFAAAFGGSTNQNDYRWGKLHRITFGHVFGGLAPQFSVPTAGGFADLSPALPGLATDGGFETIDNAAFGIRGASSQAYVYRGGAARRYVGELRRGHIKAEQIIPGGESGVAGNRFHVNQLPLWLTNKYHRVLFSKDEIQSNQHSKTVYHPAR